jgi:PAS domain S-box-containing protein
MVRTALIAALRLMVYFNIISSNYFGVIINANRMRLNYYSEKSAMNRMLNEKIYKVFICAPYSDLVEERESVLDAVRRLHLLHGSMEFFGARPRGPLETSLEEVRSSDIVIVIIGHRYGTFVPGREQSFTEVEYEEAWKNEKPCLVYFRSEDVPILPSKMERDPAGIKALEKFKKKLRERHTVALFEKADDLAVQVVADLRRHIDFIEEKNELITERKRAEEALRESEKKYRMLVDNIQDGVFILKGTPYPKLIFCNEAFAKMVGYTIEEMLGSTFQQYIAPDDLERFVNHYHRSQEGEDVPQECEYRMLHKDGRLVSQQLNFGMI